MSDCPLCGGARFYDDGRIVHSSNGKAECPLNPYWWTATRQAMIKEDS